jgi:hypothetical protein
VTVRAAFLLVAQALANLAMWVPLPLAVLWVASQLEYKTDSLMLGVAAGFAVLFVGVKAGIALIGRIDAAWLDASTTSWREGALSYIAATCAVVGGGGFGIWLVMIGGLQSSMFPSS